MARETNNQVLCALSAEPRRKVLDASSRVEFEGRTTLHRTGDIERIREGLRSGREFQVTLTNHRADGSTFRNQLLIAPVHSAGGDLTAFFGVQRLADEAQESLHPASGERGLALLRELQHRVKNHLAMVVSVIRLQGRREVTPDSLKAISRRFEALALLYEERIAAGGSDTKEVAAGPI